MSQTGTTTNSFGTLVSNLLSGLEGGIFSMVLSVLTLWVPQFVNVTSEDLTTIGNNFRAFLVAVQGGQTWGSALADMLTADWNAVQDDAKTAAIDFASDVATTLETAGLIPQGK